MPGLRIAFLCYRGNPHSGGQGVYTRYLTRELHALGHDVTVFAGPPWPVLDEGVRFEPVPSLDIYAKPWPRWYPSPSQLRTGADWLEWGLSMTGQFPEARTFSSRIERMWRRGRFDEFDVVHDNQCLGPGLLSLVRAGVPFVETVHHPITVDRDLALESAETRWQRMTLHRWYSFIPGQIDVAKQMPSIITVSSSSKRDIAVQMGVSPERMSVVPVGVDHTRFRPLPHITRVPGRLFTTASADVPLKGLVPLLEALAKVRTERPDAHLVVVGKPRDGSAVPDTIDRLGIADAVRFEHAVSDERMVELYAEAEVAVVPSLYEGFSLPAVEAMSSGVPLVATTGGAIPEVVGTSGDTARLVPPGDPGALAGAVVELLEDRELRERLAAGGQARVLERFTWRSCAEQTVEVYKRC